MLSTFKHDVLIAFLSYLLLKLFFSALFKVNNSFCVDNNQREWFQSNIFSFICTSLIRTYTLLWCWGMSCRVLWLEIAFEDDYVIL